MTRLAFLMVAATAALPGAAAAADWNMALGYPATNYHSETAVGFAECVAAETDGGLTITTHPDGAWIAAGAIMAAVANGEAPIGERLISAEAERHPLYAVDSVPFLATSFDASDRLWQAALDGIQAALDQQNLIYLYAVPWPPQGLYTDKAVRSAADLSGLSFRAYNAMTGRLAELAGMKSVQIEAADLVPALADGSVDAFMSSAATGVDDEVWRYMDHFYDVRGWLPHNVVVINKDAWNGLDAPTRRAILSCGDKAAEAGEARAREVAAGDLARLAEGGITVTPPGDRLKSDLDGFGQTLTVEWLERAGGEGRAVLEAYRKE